MKYPLLRRIERGQSVSLPCPSHGYAQRPAPSDGVVYETREDTYFIPSEMLRAAGWVRDRRTTREVPLDVRHDDEKGTA